MGYAWSQQDESVGAGFLRIATEQMAKSILNADAIGEAPARRIHSARRHCKRLRGLLRLVRSDFPAYKQANAAIRDAADRLSSARDAAVLRETLEELYRWAGQPVPAAPADEAGRSGEEPALQHFRTDITAILIRADGWKIGKINRDTLTHGFARCYRRAADAAEHCRHKPSDESFHDWRKQVKYHAFHLILLKSCLADDGGPDLEPVEKLADLLGRHHDLAVLRVAVEQKPETLGKNIDAGFVAANVGLLQDRLSARALGLADVIFAHPASAVRDTIDSRWRAWWHPASEPELA